MRPFKTPLAEVSTQIDFDTSSLVEFRARSFYDLVKAGYPHIQRLPVVLVADPASLQNAHVPAYRFFSEDGKDAIQVGPRMVTVNAITWTSYDSYRDTVNEVIEKFQTIGPDELVIGYSIGFYNRIPVADLEEASAILRLRLDVDDRTQFDGLSYQIVREVDIGTIMMQVIAAQPDERMRERHLMVNNIVRHNLMPGIKPFKEVTLDFHAWFERAHELAKEVFWDSLTPETQMSWKSAAEA